MISVVLGISVMILLSNTLLLKPLYYNSIRNSMLSGMELISSIDYTRDTDIWRDELDASTAGSSFDVVIRTEAKILYSSSREFGIMSRPDDSPGTQAGSQTYEASPPDDMPSGNGPVSEGQAADEKPNLFLGPRLNNADFEQVKDGIYLGTVHAPNSDAEMLICTKSLDNGIDIYVTQAVEPINQSVSQANILLLACALLSLGISVLIVFKISKRFTRPIREIQHTVGKLAELNFTQKCDVKTRDELQSLGEDVNRLGSELKSALDTLKLQNEQLEKDIIAERQFISNASHELRTPLALIKGYADEMNAGFASTEPQKDLYISIIAEEAAKMNRLLKEMLDLTRMESGRTEILSERLSVSERIKAFIEKYDGFIYQNGLHITLQLNEDAVGVFDAMRFEQVLANYISNAARYGDEKKLIRISSQIAEETIRVSVFNTGKPIPQDMMENIWNSFYKADSARTRVKDSYGLGLSVVKAIQTMMGQGFGAENVDGGVIFWFEVKRFRE